MVTNPARYSFIPVRLVGETCNLPVTWRTEWTPEPAEGNAPIFFGEGHLGIIGYVVSGGSPWEVSIQPGTLRVWATVAGREYGPVTIIFTGGGYYS